MSRPQQNRWIMFSTPKWLGGWGIGLHYICRSEMPGHFHDHPFWFVSIILHGPGYMETTLDRQRFRPRFFVNCRRAEHLHRLDVTAPVWTLILRGPINRKWRTVYVDENGVRA